VQAKGLLLAALASRCRAVGPGPPIERERANDMKLKQTELPFYLAITVHFAYVEITGR